MRAVVRDRLGSLLMLAFLASLWVQRDYMTPFGGIFPDIIMECLAGLVVVTLILSFTPFRAIKDDADKKEEEPVAKRSWFEMVVVAVILLAWTASLRYLGFAFTGIFGFGGISWFLSERRSSPKVIATCFIIGVGITVFLIYIFEHLLLVPLPAGRIFG